MLRKFLQDGSSCQDCWQGHFVWHHLYLFTSPWCDQFIRGSYKMDHRVKIAGKVTLFGTTFTSSQVHGATSSYVAVKEVDADGNVYLRPGKVATFFLQEVVVNGTKKDHQLAMVCWLRKPPHDYTIFRKHGLEAWMINDLALDASSVVPVAKIHSNVILKSLPFRNTVAVCFLPRKIYYE
ncbi:hypothetical protein DM01DRAFT_1174781 [Hesseltinella vesiculosa]|uniref:Uncharacterized protein n=1 Tax=Hesseltinella vesiculosa TaxID=101127 RepID=A0A1X2G4U1_9FUNG|nr:hypothetical protein DM01DRAFT_1174781 [Hesseltinella vesiculosa]